MLTAADIRARLFTAVQRSGSQRAFAAKHGISNASVSLVLAGKREPDAAVANALGYVTRTFFTPIRSAADAG